MKTWIEVRVQVNTYGSDVVVVSNEHGWEEPREYTVLSSTPKATAIKEAKKLATVLDCPANTYTAQQVTQYVKAETLYDPSLEGEPA